jgi:hypothetical protein
MGRPCSRDPHPAPGPPAEERPRAVLAEPSAPADRSSRGARRHPQGGARAIPAATRRLGRSGSRHNRRRRPRSIRGRIGALGVAVSGTGLLGAAWVARRAWATATTEVLKRPLEGAYVRYVRQPDYSGKLGYLHLVEEDMVRALELLTADQKPAVIFIDDLDRCSPAKVGEVIEAVNLFLAGEYPNCAFVIGIDAEVVAASMEVVHAEIIAKLADRRGSLVGTSWTSSSSCRSSSLAYSRTSARRTWRACSRPRKTRKTANASSPRPTCSRARSAANAHRSTNSLDASESWLHAWPASSPRKLANSANRSSLRERTRSPIAAPR